MNEQQLQQILTIQQAIAAAATAAVINSLLNPQQAGANANALTDPTANTDLQQQLQQHHQQQVDSRQQSPATSSSPANQIDSNARIQELLLQLQQQAVAGGAGGGAMPMNAATAALNLNLSNNNNGNPLMTQANLVGASGGAGSPISSRSPVNGRLLGQQQASFNAAATSSGNTQQSNQVPPNKKLKRHQQQFQSQQQNRPPLEATSKPQHSTPKNHSAISNLNSRSNSNNSTNSSSSSTFLSNNVGLPRKLVRGQDVWLGRGAEQTRQILKCMWCGQSFRTLAEMTQHMKITQHYTNIISQEQITSWRQPENQEASSNKNNSKQSAQFRSLDDNNDDLSDKFNDSDSNISNEDVNLPIKTQRNNRSTSDLRASIRKELSIPAIDSSSTISLNREELSPNRTPSKGSAQQLAAKPLTRSRRRENDDVKPASTIKITATETSGRENSPVSSSSSQQRLNNNTSAVLSDLNEDSEANKKSKIEKEKIEALESDKNDETEQDDSEKEFENSIKSLVENELLAKQEEREIKEKSLNDTMNDEHENSNSVDKTPIDELATDYTTTSDRVAKNEELADSNQGTDRELEDATNDREDDDDDDEVEEDVEIRYKNNDDNEDEDKDASDSKDSVSDKISKKLPKVRESIAIQATDTTKSNTAGQLVGGDPDDPLSALETMVEKSFDPRLRPGVANGGILQRLGIDEEVCPPWQHINYANWYAAAAYGHPMAAALLAAGINLQNGIKLSKNITPKKSDE